MSQQQGLAVRSCGVAAAGARCCQLWLLRGCSRAPGCSGQLALPALALGSSKQPPAGLSREVPQEMGGFSSVTVWSHMVLHEDAKPQLQAKGWALSTPESCVKYLCPP